MCNLETVTARITWFISNPIAREEVAAKLGEKGFLVVAASDYGVHILGEVEQFEDYFGDVILTKQGYHFKEEVILPEPLYPPKSIIYFPNTVEIYS
jgi:hypothetical protein